MDTIISGEVLSFTNCILAKNSSHYTSLSVNNSDTQTKNRKHALIVVTSAVIATKYHIIYTIHSRLIKIQFSQLAKSEDPDQTALAV